MDNPPPALPKKGLGPLAWIGIGCGGIIVLIVIGLVAFSVMFGGKIKDFAAEAQKNPTRAAATAAITFGAGQIEMAQEDDANRRYTLREKRSGKLTTIYWSEKKKAPETVEGDFSAIPMETPEAAAPPLEPEPAPPAAPAPAP